MNTKQNKIAYLLSAITIFFWSSAYVGIRAVMDVVTPFELCFLRLFIASICLIILSFFKKPRLPEKKDMLLAASTGVVLFGNFLFINFGAKTVTSGEIGFILNTSPVIVALLAFFFLKEKITKGHMIGLVCCLIGVAMIAFNGSSGLSLNRGVLLISLASLTYSIFFVLQKPLLKKYTPLEVTSYSMWIATILMGFVGFSGFSTFQSISLPDKAIVIYLGVCPSIVAFLCWSMVLSKINVSLAATFLYLVPFVSLTIGFIALGELPSLNSFIGGLIACVGVIIANRKPKTKMTEIINENKSAA